MSYHLSAVCIIENKYFLAEAAMDLIKQLFEEHAGVFTDALSKSGFTTEQANSFLPDAASSLIDATDSMEISEMVSMITSGDKTELLEKINVDEISENHDLDAAQVTDGFSSIISSLTELIQNETDVSGVLSSLAGGSDGVIGMAKSIFNKFIN